MPAFIQHIHRLVLPTILLTVAFGTARAQAAVPNLEIFWSINGGNMNTPFTTGSENGNGTFTYVGADTDLFSGAALTWSVLGQPDLTNTGLLNGGITLHNTSAQDIDVFLRLIFPIDLPSVGGTHLGGSATVTFTTDSGGGRLETLPGSGIPLWQALLDGNPVGPLASMFHDPFLVEHTGLQSSAIPSNFGLPGFTVSGADVTTSIGIELNFRLSAFDQFSITGPLAVQADVIPAPGSLALLVMSGLVLVKRRRRSSR